MGLILGARSSTSFTGLQVAVTQLRSCVGSVEWARLNSQFHVHMMIYTIESSTEVPPTDPTW